MNGSEDLKNSPTVKAAQAVAQVIVPLLKEHDPRALVQGLLMSSVTLTQQIIAAKRWTHADAAMEFSQALCAAMDAAPEESRIQLVDATGAPTRQ